MGFIPPRDANFPAWQSKVALELNKLIAAGSAAATALELLTFNNGGAGAASGSTYDGSVARTISYNTIGAFAAYLTIEASASTSYTLVLADALKHKRFTAATAIAVTVPPNASVAFPVGTRIRITAAGAGQVTLTPGAGVSLRSRDSALKSGGQYAVFEIEKVGTNEWDVLGDVTA